MPAPTRLVLGALGAVGDQEGFGFVARAIDYGGVDFEDNSPETLAEAMTVLEAGLKHWFEKQGEGSS